MTLTLDLRQVAPGLACVALGFAFHAAAAPPKSQYEFRCIGADAAKVDVYAASTMNEGNGWNVYLSKMASQGWEPIQFITSATSINAVCMRRVAPVPPPETPRCTAAEQAEMRKSGMSESAVKAACEGR